jgi:hypothetical protein
VIAVPSVEEVEEYGRRPEPRSLGVPLIADDEAVCRVRVLETGSGAYWSQGDVDVHVLHARERGQAESWLAPGEAWLAVALRERRERRERLRRGGVQTTASGLMVLRAQRQLVLPAGV